jgi:hypothetical protein
MMTQHEIIRDRIKAYEIGSSFFLLGLMFDSMDAIKDSDLNHYQVCYVQARKLHTSLVSSLRSFESTILSFKEFQQDSSEAVNTSLIDFLGRYPDLKDFLIFGRFSSGVITMATSHLPDNIVYDQKIVDIATKHGIPNETIENLLRHKHEIDSSVLQDKFDQICNNMANQNDNTANQRIIHTDTYIETNNGFVQINMREDLNSVAAQIQSSINRLQKEGKSSEEAEEKVAQDIAIQAQNDPTTKEKLKKWGESIGTATVTDVVKGAVKLAIRLAGIPIP